MKGIYSVSVIRLFLLAGMFLLAACGGGGGGGGLAVFSKAKLVSIEVTPTNPSIAAGTTVQLAATGIYSDNTTQDLTASVTWSSSNIAKVTINSIGLAAGIETGLFDITAVLGNVSGETTLTVTAAFLVSIEITPPNPTIANGTLQQFTATGIFSDNSKQDLTNQAAWMSSDESAATISNAAGSNGLATSVLTGFTTITASSGGKSGSTTLTVSDALLVSISVTPTNPSIAKGLTKQFTATGTYSDKTTQNLTSSVTWASSNESVAGISNVIGSYGLATSPGNGATGQTTITARYPNTSISGSSTLTVTPATLVSIAITPANPSVARGLTKQFTAKGTYTDNTEQDLTGSVTWSSSNETVATISNAAGSNGLSTSIGIGSTTITAASGGKSGTTTLTVTSATLVSIAVTPVNPSIAKGLTKQFAATGTYTDSSTQDITGSVTWSSSNNLIAGISNAVGSKGLATSIDVGGTTITAIDAASGKNASTTLTVTSALLQLIEVTPAGSGITYRSTQQFTALAHYTDGVQDVTGSVTWESTNPSTAAISNADGSRGLATAVAYSGSTTIKATNPDTGHVGATTLSIMQGGSRIWQQTSSVASDAEPFAAAISGNYIYVVGYDMAGIDDDRWRVEKRALSDGYLDLAFGTEGIVTSDPSTRTVNPTTGTVLNYGFDDPYAIVADDTSIYVVGYDSAGLGEKERWRIEKRSVTIGQLDGTFGSGSGVVTSSPAGDYNEPFAVAKDSTSLYVVGFDMDADGNEEWRIEKRDASTGNLAPSFGNSGVVTSANGPNENEALAIAIDGTSMYVAGYDAIATGNEEWRIEKRSLQDGSLDLAFGTGGVVLSNPSSGYDEATAIAVDSTYVYVAGYDSQPGSANTRWRIEKRKLSDGSLDTLFGSGGVAVSNPSTNYDAPTSLVVDRTKGYLYVAGYDSFTSEASGKWRIEKRRIDTGALEPSFGAGGVVTIDPNSGASDTPWAIAIDPVNPYIYVSGYATSEGGSRQWQIEKMVK